MPPNNLTARKLPSGNNKTDYCEIIPVEKKTKAWYEFETDIIWKNAIFMISIHLISLYCTLTFNYFQHKILCVWRKCLITI